MTDLGAFASMPHYWRHIEPIAARLAHLDCVLRAWSSREGSSWGPILGECERGLLVLVASHSDARRVFPAPVVYVEHGAGQSYVDPANGGLGWSGSPGLDHVRLFICPSEAVADRWRARYPRAEAVAVGSPALDRYERSSARSGAPRVALTWHWNCGVTPETRSAWGHYTARLGLAVAAMRDDGFEVVGHAHPRIERRVRARYAELGVEWVDLDGLLSADVVVADNTSAMYEAAALGARIVALNAPWYRRDVEHGLRFWSHVPGIECDRPLDLADAVREAFVDRPDLAEKRAAGVAAAYAHNDRHASERAARAIMELAR